MKRSRGSNEEEEMSPSAGEGAPKKAHAFTGATTLAAAAKGAPQDDKARFEALVKKLGAGKEKVQDLLAKGELWAAVHAAAERANATITLGAFFDYCKREMDHSQAPAERRKSNDSNEDPAQLPGKTSTKLFKDEVLNRVYDLVGGKSITFPDFSSLQKTFPVQRGKSRVEFPRDVNVENKVDLRLPHSNPLLEGDDHPLKQMRDDLLGVTEFHVALLIGSSGCGKTTTAFLAAEKHFTLFMEVYETGTLHKGYHIELEKFSRTRNQSEPSFDDIKRRALREIVARAVLLAIAFQRTRGALEPYQWLLYSLSRDFFSLVDELKGGLSDDVSVKILKAVENLIGQKVMVVLDEAHLLCGDKKFELPIRNDTHSMNALSAFTCGITNSGAIDWIHSLVLLGTQMSLERGARVASSVYKTNAVPVVALCKFPFLEAWHKNEDGTTNPFCVEKSLSKCLEDGFIRWDESLFRDMCLRFQGRARVVASFIAECLHSEEDVLALFSRYDSPGIKEEISRLRGKNDSKLDVSHLYELWYRSIIGECRFPLGEFGTVVFTQDLVKNGMKPFGKTGVHLAHGSAISFVHRLDEPILVEGIVSFLEQKGSSPFKLLHRHMSEQVKATTNASARGTFLDALVLLRAVCVSSVNSSTLGSFFSADVAWKDASFCVKRIVGGVGMLNAWAKMIVSDPDLCVMPGIKARHVAVLPEANAGADGVFAAFNRDGSVVFVSFACAWYEDGVTAEKVKDQTSKSDLSNQFQSVAALETKSQSKKPGVLTTRREELKSLLAKGANNLRVVVELPHRNGSRPKEFEGGIFVIDDRNVGRVLEFQPKNGRSGEPVMKKSRPDSDGGKCRHNCMNKQDCKHTCCKK